MTQTYQTPNYAKFFFIVAVVAAVIEVVVIISGMNKIDNLPYASPAKQENILTNSELHIQLIPPSEEARLFYDDLFYDDHWTIYLDGTIDSSAPERLEKLLIENSIGHGYVYLNSPGGDLAAGIRLGRLFRNHGFLTQIGRFDGVEITPGQCLSACPFAFVGGYFRYLDINSTLGVHRFTTETTSPSDIVIAQVASGEITSYLSEMGVDTALFELMVRIDNDDIYRLSVDEAENWLVANNGKQAAQWSIELQEKALYLKGVQETVWGTGKSMFLCDKGKIIFTPMYLANINVDFIIKNTIQHSLRIDDEFIPLESVSEFINANGYILAVFRLDEIQLELIREAKAIGYAAHPKNRGIFWGFTVDIGTSNEKIRNFLSSCEMLV
jgi:hypothetical protein